MKTKDTALVGAFTALAIVSDFALTDFANVKLVDPIVFSVAFVFGLEMGVYVGVLSELIWGTFNPLGFGGYIIPFLVAGEVLFALAGWTAARVWAGERSRLATRNFYFGAVLAVCAFVWDLETQVGTALISFWPSLTLQKLLATEVIGIPFMLSHEVSDLVTGAVFAPFIIFYASRVAKPHALAGEK
jgi:hypothetical protein